MKLLLGIVIGVIVLSVARPHLQRLFDSEHGRIVEGARSATLISSESGAEADLAPGKDLEEIDITYLCKARESIDVAMFAFTDKRIADALKQLAIGHVKVRIYRDQKHCGQEQENAARVRDRSSSILLRGSVNIQIRVNQGSEGNAMHQSGWCLDHRLLRDGSADWSVGGEKTQDNQIRLTTDRQPIAAFERSFEAMWSRANNRVVQ